MQKEIKFKLIKHLTFLEKELKDYPTFKSITWKEYNEDNDKRRSVERWIENLINSSIDISKIILSAEGRSPGDSYKETVKLLALVPGFDEKSIKALSEWVRLRNIISHEYLDIRWASIKKFLTEAVPLYEYVLTKVKAYLEKKVVEEGKQ